MACQMADAWLPRLELPNRARLRRYAMEQNLGAGCLHFHFEDAPPANHNIL